MGVASLVSCIRVLFAVWVTLVIARPAVKRDHKLVFDQNGQFKIAQFADLHFGEAENTLWGPQQDVNSTRVMEHVLLWEQPNLVIYSGDQITGENIDNNATSYWARLLRPCLDTNTPWATVFGNHDDRSSMDGTRKDLLEFDTSFNLSHSKFGPSTVHGLTNYYLLIYPDQQATKPSWIIYILDSGGGTYPELVYPDQIQWFIDTSSHLQQIYGQIPALAYFHIPSTGYEDQYRKTLCIGMNDDDVTPQIEANGLLSVLATTGGVVWVSVGHDHGNDWCCPSLAGLTICYGRHTGYGGYGRWPRGSRMVVLKKDSMSVETYVRMENGSIIHGNTYTKQN